jgi:hypothetical protein
MRRSPDEVTDADDRDRKQRDLDEPEKVQAPHQRAAS